MLNPIRSLYPSMSGIQLIASIKAHPIHTLGITVLILSACYVLKSWMAKPPIAKRVVFALSIKDNMVTLTQTSLNRLQGIKNKLKSTQSENMGIYAKSSDLIKDCLDVLELIDSNKQLDLSKKLNNRTDESILDFFRSSVEGRNNYKRVITELSKNKSSSDLDGLHDALKAFLDFAHQLSRHTRLQKKETRPKPFKLLQNSLYFIPIVGTIHHARESYQLDVEYQKLIMLAPSIKDMSGMNSISARLSNATAYKELDTLKIDLKIRATQFFANKNEVDKFGFWGSTVQVIICLAAQVLNPAFFLLARLESLHMLYSFYKLVAGPDSYYYDSEKNASVVHRRDLFGESAIFGKRIVPAIIE